MAKWTNDSQIIEKKAVDMWRKKFDLVQKNSAKEKAEAEKKEKADKRNAEKVDRTNPIKPLKDLIRSVASEMKGDDEEEMDEEEGGDVKVSPGKKGKKGGKGNALHAIHKKAKVEKHVKKAKGGFFGWGKKKKSKKVAPEK